MYCIQCGVELAEAQHSCPLCGTEVYHPGLDLPKGEGLYPRDQHPPRQVRPWGMLTILTALFLLPIIICLVCDRQLSGEVTWSGYAVGGLTLFYIVAVLPGWFRRPHPTVFVPCDFLAVLLLLHYINFHTAGDWFLTFAFPLTAGLGLIVTAVVVLTRYIRRGRLYVYGGASLTLAAFMPVLELLMNLTLHREIRFIWSPYPLTALVLLGAVLLLTAICRPLRESLDKRLFI